MAGPSECLLAPACMGLPAHAMEADPPILLALLGSTVILLALGLLGAAPA